MSLDPALQESERNHCEEGRCNPPGRPDLYCVDCDARLCKSCWTETLAHRSGKVGRDKMPHEKTNYYTAKRFESILHPPDSADELQRLHEEDEVSTWFGVTNTGNSEHVLKCHSTYADLMAQSQHLGQTTKFPHLVSFIGQTSAGKSTLVKMLIASREGQLSRVTTSPFPSPVVGSPKNDQIPTSADVHLYADPATFFEWEPMLYADCEGLDAGEELPMGAEAKKKTRQGAKRLVRKAFSNTRVRRIDWANTDQKCTRQFAVTELYPRLLYTFSDVVVFVLRNAKTFQSAALQKLLEWGSESLEKSVGQPILPHAIIAVNATDILVEATEWDVNHATAQLLDSVKNSLDSVPEFRKLVKTWRGRGRTIDKVLDLILCYYSSFSVVRIPVKGRYGLMDNQVTKLHEKIVQRCKESYDTKRSARMLSSAEELDVYIQAGFDHFSNGLEKPFNFVQVAIDNNPIPDDFGGHIVQLAILMLPHFPKDAYGAHTLFSKLSSMVASCIFLNCVLKLKGLATVLFESYRRFLDSALADFCNLYWPCEFKNAKGRCVNVKSRHNPKGHQNASGKIIDVSSYQSAFSFEGYTAKWTQDLRNHIRELQGEHLKDITSNRSIPEKDIAFKLHKERISKFYRSLGSATNFTNHATCLSCLMGVPEYPLPCGHVLCFQCVKSHGQDYEGIVLTFDSCPLHPEDKLSRIPWPIRFKPDFAGVRILSLDGGGIRGIVELETLRAIQESLGSKIPISKFFDLIVGTSTGGIIALAIGVKNWSVDNCISRFVEICDRAFTPRELHRVPGMHRVTSLSHGSLYKTRPLIATLQEEFGCDLLFGGPRESEHRDSAKVAVTSTDEAGKKAIIFANYRHYGNNTPSWEFHRPSSPELEMKIWEAAAATSAAPTYFKPFYHKVAGRHYLDGALYNNNPVRVAHSERRMLWPDVSSKAPDIFLSIGTGQNEKEVKNKTGSTLTARGDVDPALKGKQKSTGRVGRWRQIFSIMLRRIDSILNAETAWSEFCADILESSSEDANKQRYIRINPDLGDNVPRLDEKKRLHKLQEDTRKILQSPAMKAEIERIAQRLVAGLFYYERKTPPRREQDNSVSCSGAIRCRFAECLEEESIYIRALGEFLSQQMDYGPYFEIIEDETSEDNRKVEIKPQAIDQMIKGAMFSIDDCTLQVPTKTSSVNITLWLRGKHNRARSYPISGFPRKIMAEESLKLYNPKQSGLRRHNSLPSAMKLPDRVIDDTPRSKTIPVVEKSSKYQIDNLIHKETQAWTGQSEDEELRNPRFGAVRNLIQSYQQLSIGSSAPPARPLRMKSSSVQRSSSLSRRATVGLRLETPSGLDPEFQRDPGLTKDLNTPNEARSAQDEGGIWDHLNLPPEDVEDSSEVELMVGSERSVWDE